MLCHWLTNVIKYYTEETDGQYLDLQSQPWTAVYHLKFQDGICCKSIIYKQSPEFGECLNKLLGCPQTTLNKSGSFLLGLWLRYDIGCMAPSCTVTTSGRNHLKLHCCLFIEDWHSHNLMWPHRILKITSNISCWCLEFPLLLCKQHSEVFNETQVSCIF